MAASSQSMAMDSSSTDIPIGAPLDVGITFASYFLFKLAMDNWAVKEHFAFCVPRKDDLYAIYSCREDTCHWTVKARLNDEEVWEVYDVEPEHSCLTSGRPSRSVVNSQRWLQETIPRHMVVTTKTTVQQIIDCLGLIYHETIHYQAAHKARAALLNNTLEMHRNAFHKLPQYIERLEQLDREGHFHLELDDDTFSCIFISPAYGKSCFSLCRRIFAVDSTFLTGKFVLTLLLAVGIDVNKESVILAWAIVEGENTNSWKYFFHHFRLAMGTAFSEQIVAISDRDKGLDSGLNDFGLPDTLTHLICCQHLKENIIKGKGGSAIAGHFWKVARAKTEERFHYHMTKLREVSAFAAGYLETIDPALYAEAYVPCQRFGIDTSNMVESINSVLKQDRQKDVLSLLLSIWDRVMASRHSRFCEALTNIKDERLYTPHCAKLIAQSRGFAGGCHICMSTDSDAKVATAEGWIFDVKVDWETKKCDCSCRRPYQTELPCGHIMVMLFHQHKSLEGFIPWSYSCYHWMNQHTTPLAIVGINDFSSQSLIDCLPPTTRVPRGRPRKERIREGGIRNRQGLGFEEMTVEAQHAVATNWGRTHYSTCGGLGHNARSCRRPHT